MSFQTCSYGRENFENQSCPIYDKNMTKSNHVKVATGTKTKENFCLYNYIIIQQEAVIFCGKLHRKERRCYYNTLDLPKQADN